MQETADTTRNDAGTQPTARNKTDDLPHWRLVGRRSHRTEGRAILDRLVSAEMRRSRAAIARGQDKAQTISDAMANVGYGLRRDDVYAVMSSCCAHDDVVVGQIRDALATALEAG